MKAILATPVEVKELGLIMFKLGQLTDAANAMAAGGRMLLSEAPAVLNAHQSGVVTIPEVSKQSVLVGNESLYPLWDAIQSENPLFNNAIKANVELIQHCQCKDDHCHKERITRHVNNSFVKLCWAHDNELNNEALIDVARLNQSSFWAGTIASDMGLPVSHPVSIPELCWWLTVNKWITKLPDPVMRDVLGRPESSFKKTALGYKSTDDLYLPRPSEQIEVLSKPVVNFLVDDEPPARFMLRPKPICWKSDSYLRYVKSLPCVCCGQQADDPHHVIGHGQGKMGGKAHDLLTMPVCRKHHDQIHRNVEAWEREHGSQISHVLRTIDRALKEGALV